MQFCFQEQQPHVCIYQCPTFSTLSLDQQVLQHFCSSALLRQGRPTCAAPWVALCCTCWVSFQAEGPLPYLHAMVRSCCSWIYLQEGWLRICYSALKVSHRTQVELSPAIHIQGKHKHWHSPVSLVWVVPSIPKELSWFPNLLYAEAVQLAHRKIQEDLL